VSSFVRNIHDIPTESNTTYSASIMLFYDVYSFVAVFQCIACILTAIVISKSLSRDVMQNSYYMQASKKTKCCVFRRLQHNKICIKDVSKETMQ
jgi:hypothetical protein